MIQNQIALPLRAALGVALQGIRIRIERSLVTIGGVVLGIAFLMASLVGQVAKKAVFEEDKVRTEVGRMASALAAEIGPPRDSVLGVVQTGPINEVERRLIQHLIDSELRRLQWHRSSPAAPLPELSLEPAVLPLDSIARDANAVLVIGSGRLPAPLAASSPLAQLFEDSRENVLASTRAELAALPAPGISVVRLDHEPTSEDRVKAAQFQHNARIRAIWIVALSLLVTVGGIANAMLMSVTERFREIGTMKCLGALSSFIRWVFLIEAGLLGAVGGVVGAGLGACCSLTLYGLTYGFGTVLTTVNYVHVAGFLLLSVATAIVLSIVAAIYPASMAASMVPAHALTTNV